VQSQLETWETERKICLRRYRPRGEGKIRRHIEVLLDSVDYMYWGAM